MYGKSCVSECITISCSRSRVALFAKNVVYCRADSGVEYYHNSPERDDAGGRGTQIVALKVERRDRVTLLRESIKCGDNDETASACGWCGWLSTPELSYYAALLLNTAQAPCAEFLRTSEENWQSQKIHPAT
ncbi:hypothetical protein J6590_091389 [Homalodisca vitripennis]|nr:hypothetical protein J6590_091389 [Homalodisca vitripennis]